MPARNTKLTDWSPSYAFPSWETDTLAHLTDVGARHVTKRILDHWDRVRPKLAKYGFARFGFSPAWVRAMDALAVEIRNTSNANAERKSGTLETGAALDHAMASAKDWRSDAQTTVAIMPLHARKPLHVSSGSSVKALYESIGVFVPVLSKADAKKFGGGPDVAKNGKQLAKALIEAHKAHTQALGSLSPELRLLYLKKGVVYEELRRLARVARRVAKNESKLFSVSRHVHRASRPTKDTTIDTSTPKTPPASTKPATSGTTAS